MENAEERQIAEDRIPVSRIQCYPANSPKPLKLWNPANTVCSQ